MNNQCPEGRVYTDTIEVRHAKVLPPSLSCERIAVGEKHDYKPCLPKLRSGELLLTAYHTKQRCGRLWRSADGGLTWKQQVDVPVKKEAYLTILADGTAFLNNGNSLHRSTDNGRTWQAQPVEMPEPAGQSSRPPIAGTSYNVGELRDGTLVFAVMSSAEETYLWRSSDRGETWDSQRPLKMRFHGIDPAEMPYGTLLGEAFFWRAPNGDMLVPARVIGEMFPLKGRPAPPVGLDHNEGMALWRSQDDGANWSLEEFGAYYGEMYPSILRLQDGRLLFTFTMRAAIEPNKPPLGVRAVLGREVDAGFEFDFENDRIMLDTKTPIGQMSGGGFGPTVQLDDGTLVTCYSYTGSGDWGEDEPFCVEVVRWRLPK